MSMDDWDKPVVFFPNGLPRRVLLALSHYSLDQASRSADGPRREKVKLKACQRRENVSLSE
jgi:hypothetical protein